MNLTNMAEPNLPATPAASAPPPAASPPVPPQPPVLPPPAPQKTAPAQSPQRIRPKVGKNVLTCWTYSVILAVMGLSVCLLLAAKSGVFTIPFFSSYYLGPMPSRLVKSPPISAEDFEASLGDQLRAAAQKNKTPPYVIRLTERELTGAMSSGVENALRDDKWKYVFTQIAVEPTEIELVGQFRRGWIRLDVMVRFVPRLVQGGVSFEPVYVQIGDYRLPPQMTYQIIGYLFSRDLGAWVLNFGDLRLSEVHLSRGYLELVVASTAPRP